MLVISRMQGDGIMIGNDIEVTIERIASHQVRVGIKAPEHISINRTEVYLAQKQQTRNEPPRE